MSVRVNKAKNFRNKAYVAADELDSLIQSMTFAGNVGFASGTHFGENANDDWVINFTTADVDAQGNHTTGVSSVDLTAIKDYIDNKSITVTAGNGIAIDSTTNPLSPTISTDIDLKAVDTVTGYAATYQLFIKNNGTATSSDVNGYTPIGAKINIVKDNLVKSGSLVYGTALSGNTLTNENASRVDETYKPYVKLVLNTNTDGDSTNDETITNLYIPVNDLFDSYTAGNKAINSAALTSNVITVVVDGTNKVYTATATTGASILTIGDSGIMVADIQGAINYAVTDEHTKASAAISGTNDKLIALGSATSAAVVSLNARVETVASNAESAVSAVVADIKALDSKVDSAFVDADTKIENAIDSVITNVNTAIDTNITNINTSIGAAIDTVNTKVSSAVFNVNTEVAALAGLTSSAVANVNDAVSAFKDTVTATITSNNTVFGNTITSTNNAIGAAVTNVNTALGTSAANITDARAVTVEEVTIAPVSQAGGSGIYATTVNAKYIIAVFGEEGDQIYPDIERGTALTGNDAGKYPYTLTAEYGSVTADSSWHIICANNVAVVATPDAITGTFVDSTAFTNGTNQVAYTNADEGTDASYDNVTKTDAGTVDAADVTYNVTTIADKTVANGTAATVPAVPARTDKAVPNYSGYSA